MLNTIIFWTVFSYSISANSQNNPIELGKVTWLRDYDQAIIQAEKTSKPIFILFQEVPGCANCTRYGAEILSHPLMVELIETQFVPLAIYNNKSGHDKEVLVQFKEPSWNNPVVRIVDQSGNDIVPRVSDFRSKSLLTQRVIEALYTMKVNVPTYVELLHQGWAAEESGDLEEAYLSMYCFWTGEKEIAQIEGVVFTEAGYMHGREVVKVSYDKSQTNLKELSQRANRVKCADEVYTNTKIKLERPQKKPSKYRKDKEDKYYLRRSKLSSIPMTKLQQVKVNSALGKREDPYQYLSSRQIAFRDQQGNSASQVDRDIIDAWWRR